jgi:hypothetical protein
MIDSPVLFNLLTEISEFLPSRSIRLLFRSLHATNQHPQRPLSNRSVSHLQTVRGSESSATSGSPVQMSQIN